MTAWQALALPGWNDGCWDGACWLEVAARAAQSVHMATMACPHLLPAFLADKDALSNQPVNARIGSNSGRSFMFAMGLTSSALPAAPE